MGKELAKAYEPAQYEDEIYKQWETARENAGFFNPDNLSLAPDAKSYTIVLPPPNVTGTLHMGHAGMLAYQDVLIRYHRMKGERALWVPGTDHAAIATQTKVEKIIKEEGETRHSLGREKFLKRVDQFAQESHDTIVGQCKKMGASLDWSREAFTLDETRNKAVNSVFKLMYDDGLIYRGERIVNWCPRCHSTLADDEVEHKDTKSKLYYFKYAKDFPLTIATTRPETKLGDTAVAVNPKDERYKDLVGKVFELDFVGVPLRIKIIADREVDMEFGAGALGVTPAHAAVDWLMAEENDLDIVKVIDEDGKIKEDFSDYSRKSVKEARAMIVERLEKAGLMEKAEEIDNALSVCYRCDTVIEPLPSLQWFMDVNKPLRGSKQSTVNSKQEFDWGGKSIKDVCLEVVRDKKIKIVPDRFEKTYFNWMENLRDWCISRQIWYGHRVPVFYRNHESGIMNNEVSKKEEIFVGTEAPEDKTNFVFLHGFYRTREVKDPLNWLSQVLNRDDNFWEILPNADQPNLQEQMDFVLGKAKITEDTVIVTHSLGGILALKMIEKNDLKIKKLIILSSPLRPKSEELKEYNKGNEFDFEKIKSLVDEIVVMQPSEDHVLPLEENKELAERFDAKLVKVEKSASHFNEDKNTAVLEECRRGVWVQDEDTLDTWFSSGMWTFSTLASAPEQIGIEDGRLVIDSDDFKNFHPTQVLETGYDILFFWVARMVIMTTYAVNDIPFEDVYLHGLVLDDKGKKMSKSKGNVIDPLDMIEKYGTDATRLSLLIGSTPGNDMKLSEEKVAGFRNLVNKLWNVARYILQSTVNSKQSIEINSKNLTPADKAVLQEMRNLVKQVTDDLESYRFSHAGEQLREFTWNFLADWYIEATKFDNSTEKDKVLGLVLKDLLKLWHPFIPFVTEVIWRNIGQDEKLIVSEWPVEEKYENILVNASEQELVQFNKIIKMITDIRNARSENKVEPSRKVKAIVIAGEQEQLIKENEALIKGMRTGIDGIEYIDPEKTGSYRSASAALQDDKGAIKVVSGEIVIYLLGARDEAKEKARLKKKRAEFEKVISGIKSKLDNKNFVERAPEAVVNQEKDRLAQFEKELKELEV